jgi:hypothetical protein
VAESPAPRPRIGAPSAAGASMNVSGPTVHRQPGSRGLAAATRRGISMPSASTGKDRPVGDRL